MLFDLLNRILHSKRDVTTNIGEDSVHPYILNRWISMYSPDMAVLINNTGNWLYNVFGDDHGKYFRFLSCFLPRVKNKRIFYIRKNKKNVDVDDQSDQNVDVLAHGLELSKREIKCLLEYERQHRPTNTN
jgi:hypothetical protein